MKQTPLTNGKLSYYNLKRRPFRTSCLIIVVAVLALTLFGGAILTLSLENGLNSMKQRLGADLLVVPDGYEANMEGVLLKGEPSYFYFSNAIARQIAQVSGVSQVTSQFFLTSLSASCCSTQVQLIGFDPSTDFVIQPWIAKTYASAIGDGHIIVGSDIALDSDHTLTFFNQTYPVAAQLEKTATGLDSSVFMNMNTMKSLYTAARETGMNFISGEEPEDAVSSVPVKIEKGYDVQKIANSIRSNISAVDVIVSKNMISNISDNLGYLVTYIRVFSAVLWILAAIVLMAIFSVTMNARKKEFAVLRILGATRKKLVGIVLTESLIVSVIGGVAGVMAASLLVFPFSTYIGNELQLPYLEPKADVIIGALALSLLLSFIVGPVASIYSAAKISRAETYLTMREGE